MAENNMNNMAMTVNAKAIMTETILNDIMEWLENLLAKQMHFTFAQTAHTLNLQMHYWLHQQTDLLQVTPES